MAVGDALGAPLEFAPVRYNTQTHHDMGATGKRQGKFDLLPGQFTDDTAMGLCLADSLLCTSLELDPLDLMLRFLAWWHLGYNNSFGSDAERVPSHSVGLGGNISCSFSHFRRHGRPATPAGDTRTSGIGSIMRLAALPLAYHTRPEADALAAAAAHSKTTHQGNEVGREEGGGSAVLSSFSSNPPPSGVRVLPAAGACAPCGAAGSTRRDGAGGA